MDSFVLIANKMMSQGHFDVAGAPSYFFIKEVNVEKNADFNHSKG